MKYKKRIQKKKLYIICVCVAVAIIAIGILAICLISGKSCGVLNKPILNPETYTLEEFQALSPKEQMRFPDSFESMDAFNKWYEEVNNESSLELEIDLNGKNPEEYTWKMFQEMTPDEQLVFPDYFEDMDAFYEWYDGVKPR